MSEPSEERHVVVVVFDGVQPLDVVGPHEVFAGAGRLARGQGRGGYRLSVVAAHSHGQAVVVTTESGLRLLADPLPDLGSTPVDTLVLAGGDGVHRAAQDTELMDWVAAAAPTARRVATVCTGAFLAAHAGLLDGVTVTTHWARAARLAREFPAIAVDAEAIYRREAAVWTSAGVSAGRPGPGAGRGRPRRPDRPGGGPLAGDVPPPPWRSEPVRDLDVDPAR